MMNLAYRHSIFSNLLIYCLVYGDHTGLAFSSMDLTSNTQEQNLKNVEHHKGSIINHKHVFAIKADRFVNIILTYEYNVWLIIKAL